LNWSNLVGTPFTFSAVFLRRGIGAPIQHAGHEQRRRRHLPTDITDECAASRMDRLERLLEEA
jgi:hypothetical protein